MAGIVNYTARSSPKQTEIVQDIRRMILSRKLAPSAQLPTVAEMEERYGAARVTVQRAVTYLRKQGFVNTKSRHGIFVAQDPPCLCNLGLVRPLYLSWSRSQSSRGRRPAPLGHGGSATTREQY